MRNIIAISALALAVGLATPADAQYRSYHNHYHGGGGNWVAPLVGGLIIGGVVGALSNQPRYYDPSPVIVAPQYHRECRIVPVYDNWGYYVGDRRECYNVPNY
jgi:hypothetical protein